MPDIFILISVTAIRKNAMHGVSDVTGMHDDADKNAMHGVSTFL